MHSRWFLGGIAAFSLLLVGCDKPDFETIFRGSTTHVTYTLNTTKNTMATIEPVNGASATQISAINFGDEGHGWIVMNVSLSDGRTAVFHTAHKVRETQSILDSTNVIIPANVTKQGLGLQLLRNEFNTNTDHFNSTRNCTYYVNRPVCVYDPQTHRNVCQIQPVPMNGWQNVTETVVTNAYEIAVNMFSQTATVSSSQISATLTKRSYDYSPCYGGGYPGNYPPNGPLPPPPPYQLQ